MSAGRWIAERLKDLFYGQGNQHLELNRAFAGLGGALMVMATGWDIYLGRAIEVGPGGLGGGLAAIITAAGLAISAKDWSIAQRIKADARLKEATHD